MFFLSVKEEQLRDEQRRRVEKKSRDMSQDHRKEKVELLDQEEKMLSAKLWREKNLEGNLKEAPEVEEGR